MSTVGYTTTEELQRLLKINTPTSEQTAAMVRVITMAAVEIDSEIDRAEDDEDLTADQLLLAEEVNLERAVELWGETPWGIVGIAELGGVHTSKNTWERYAHKLAPLKTQWGIA